MNAKKALAGVVSASLIIVIAVLSVVNFSSFLDTYQSGLEADIELRMASSKDVKASVTNSKLYITSNSNIPVNVLNVYKDGNLICQYERDNSNSKNSLQFWLTYENYNSTHVFDSSGNGWNATVMDTVNYKNGLGGGKAVNVQPGNTDTTIGGYRIENSQDLGEYNKVTISTWIKSNPTPINDWHRALSKYVYYNAMSESGTWRIGLGDDITPYFSCDFYINGGTESRTRIRNVNYEEWNFVTCTYNGTTNTAYHNGEFNRSQLMSGTIDDTNIPVYIGMGGDGLGHTQNPLNGSIDETTIWNDSLSAINIKNLYYFNDIDIQLINGTTSISFTGCELKEGNKYDIYLQTPSFKVEWEIYYR